MGLRFFCVGGGGSWKYAVALLGAHTPSKNPPPISGMQAYLSYVPVSILCVVEFSLSPILRTRVNTAVHSWFRSIASC
jgi:hypothetical protein